MKSRKKEQGIARALSDADLSSVEGGAKVTTIHLYAEVPNRVDVVSGEDGSYKVQANGNMALATREERDGIRVSVTAS